MAEPEYEARGITVRDVAPAVFIESYAAHLKNSDRFEIPKWCDLVKTGVHKELAPTNEDWYFVRAADRARSTSSRASASALRKWYGGQYRRGSRAKCYQKAAAGVIRSVLQQLEETKVLEKSGGGAITRVGQQDPTASPARSPAAATTVGRPAPSPRAGACAGPTAGARASAQRAYGGSSSLSSRAASSSRQAAARSSPTASRRHASLARAIGHAGASRGHAAASQARRWPKRSPATAAPSPA
ncbi:hypothetical protein JL720_5396 [Aureococcus anophagefferens]|nr:hypothetical protein JL720_5396 [Aureococcus anophagefferens]